MTDKHHTEGSKPAKDPPSYGREDTGPLCIRGGGDDYAEAQQKDDSHKKAQAGGKTPESVGAADVEESPQDDDRKRPWQPERNTTETPECERPTGGVNEMECIDMSVDSDVEMKQPMTGIKNELDMTIPEAARQRYGDEAEARARVALERQRGLENSLGEQRNLLQDRHDNWALMSFIAAKCHELDEGEDFEGKEEMARWVKGVGKSVRKMLKCCDNWMRWFDENYEQDVDMEGEDDRKTKCGNSRVQNQGCDSAGRRGKGTAKTFGCERGQHCNQE